MSERFVDQYGSAANADPMRAGADHVTDQAQSRGVGASRPDQARAINRQVVRKADGANR